MRKMFDNSVSEQYVSSVLAEDRTKRINVSHQMVVEACETALAGLRAESMGTRRMKYAAARDLLLQALETLPEGE